jgi:hypothetical protein
MRARSYAELTTKESPNDLEFHAVRHTSLRGWIYHSVMVALAVAAGAFTIIIIGRLLDWRDWENSAHSTSFWSFMASMYVVGLVEQLLNGRVANLRISGDELTVTLNPGSKVFSRTALLATSEVESLTLTNGGLLLERNGVWGRPIWVLPGLSKEQGAAVMKAVLGKFPGIWEEFYPVGFHSGLRPLSSVNAENQESAT